MDLRAAHWLGGMTGMLLAEKRPPLPEVRQRLSMVARSAGALAMIWAVLAWLYRANDLIRKSKE